MRRKIFDGGDLKIYHTKYAISGGMLVYGRDLAIEVKGKDIGKSTKSITIHFDAETPMSYDIKMYSVFDKIKKALGGKKK